MQDELIAKPKRASDFMNQLIDAAIVPNGQQIATLHAQGHVVVVVHQPVGRAKDAAHTYGWDGRSTVFALPKRLELALAKIDHVTARWLGDTSDADQVRMFVITGEGTLLLNFKPDVGYTLEPGSTGGGALN